MCDHDHETPLHLEVYDAGPDRIALGLLDRYMPVLRGEDALLDGMAAAFAAADAPPPR